MNNKNISIILTPTNKFAWIITGLSQADSSFGISFKKSNSEIRIYPSPFFRIELTNDSYPLLKKIFIYFGCGKLGYRLERDMCYFEVTDFYSLWHIIIPHFLKYPFLGIRQNTFIRFLHALTLLYPYYNKDKPRLLLGKLIYLTDLMHMKDNTTLFSISHSHNLKEDNCSSITSHKWQSFGESPSPDWKEGGGRSGRLRPPSTSSTPNFAWESEGSKGRLISEKSQELYKTIKIEPLEVITALKPISNLQTYVYPLSFINVYFLIGIIEGDGSFYIGLRENRKIRFGFSITTHIHELDLLYKIKWLLNCGVAKVKTNTWCRYEVEGNKSLRTILMPLVDSIGLLSAKAINYKAFKEAMGLFVKKEHLTDKGLIRLARIAYSTPTGGKGRKYSLKEYLKRNKLSET